MRCACIDIGSNTTRLLVAELAGASPPTLHQVAAERVFNRETPPCDAVPRLLAAARTAGADEVVTVGTAALRADPSLAEGLDVTILSPEDEGRLAFLGAISSLPSAPEGPIAVVDVGGGSAEIVCGTVRGGVSWSTSVPVGSRSLAEAHLRSDPPTAAELDAVRAAVQRAFASVKPPTVSAGYAVGGSATSLRRLVGDVLDHRTLSRAIDALCTTPAGATAARFDLHPDRVDVLPAGMLLLDAATAALGVPLEIVCGGLREGVCLERLCAKP